MTNEEFRAWLLGYVTLTGDLPLNQKQIKIIENHANLVSAVDRFLTPENQMIIDGIQAGQRVGACLLQLDVV